MRARNPYLVVVMLSILGLACPAHDDDPTSRDETGGPGEPDPIDPFDGEGADPPGEPDPNLTYRSPSSLGNGLVHDSRYDLRAGSYMRFVSVAQLEAGVEWVSFVAPHAEKLRVGFRPTQVDANIDVTPGAAGTLLLHVEDRSVYVCDDDANYRTVTRTHVFSSRAAEQAHAGSGPSPQGSPRPTAIDTFALASDRFGFDIVWTYDDAPVDWELVVGESQQTFLGTVGNLAQHGYRPISVSSRRRNGANEYAGIFVQDGVPQQEWQLMLGRNAMELATEAATAWDNGYYPFRGSYQQGSQNLPLFDVIWMRRPPGLKLELRYNLDRALFEEEDQKWRIAGYHLEGACAYLDGGEERLSGLWVRYEPYLRWTEGIEVDLADPVYAARYEPLHDRLIQQMSFAGEQKFGEFFRPSATLHIYEGAILVLSRAYTYAGAIYPDTPLDAPMSIASASKSITAAAVVRLMNIEGLPLTTPFASLAGIKNVPAMVAGPSVLDVLRNLGGFEPRVKSYSNHYLIDQSIYGAYPITGKMMYDYAVLGGHMDVGGLDSYWNSSTSWRLSSSGKCAIPTPVIRCSGNSSACGRACLTKTMFERTCWSR